MTKSLWKFQSSFYHLLRRNPLSALLLHRENESISNLLKNMRPRSILDIGCGRGNDLGLFYNFTGSVTAVDNVLEMVHKTKEHYPGIKFIAANAQFLPFRECCFDLISCIGLFEYVDDWSILLQEIHRVLSQEAYAVITLSPPVPFTYLRLFLGHRLHTSTEEDFRKILASFALFTILQSNRTLLQYQFLLKKENTLRATGML